MEKGDKTLFLFFSFFLKRRSKETSNRKDFGDGPTLRCAVVWGGETRRDERSVGSRGNKRQRPRPKKKSHTRRSVGQSLLGVAHAYPAAIIPIAIALPSSTITKTTLRIRGLQQPQQAQQQIAFQKVKEKRKRLCVLLLFGGRCKNLCHGQQHKTLTQDDAMPISTSSLRNTHTHTHA